MKKALLFIIIVFLVISCTDKSKSINNEEISEALEVVRDSLEAELGHIVQSISLYVQTYSDVYFATTTHHEKDNITPGTYFRFASNSKNFTAAAILNMYEDGWLHFYDMITSNIPGTEIPYVPDTEAWDIPYKGCITIEQLLQHSAGVYDVDNDPVPGCGGESYVNYIFESDPTHQFTAEELVNQNTTYNLYYFIPGGGYHYSNTGYTILSEIIARVYTAQAKEEKTFADYLYDYITGPNSEVPVDVFFPYEATDVSLPNPHLCGNLYVDSTLYVFDESNMSAHVAEGNGYSNFEEINTYIRTLMRGENVLEAATVNAMQNDTSPDNENYGLGCTYTSNLGYGHNGCIRGYFSLMAYDPVYQISMVVAMPSVDMTSEEDFYTSFYGMYEAAWRAREILGVPQKK